ncbi:hypothetical protein D3C71_22140 [compost metagenome]
MRTFNKTLWVVSFCLAMVLALLAKWLGAPTRFVLRARVSRNCFMRLLRRGIHPYAAALAMMAVPFLATFAGMQGDLVRALTVVSTSVSLLLLPLAFSTPALPGPVVATRRGRRDVVLHLNQSADNPFACKTAVRDAVRELANGGARRVVMDSPLLADESLSKRLATHLRLAVESTGKSAHCTVEEPSYWNTVRSAFFAPYLRYRPANKFFWDEQKVLSRRITVDIAAN